MFDPRQFLRADPRLLHDKHLSDRAWLAYCWLELIAGRSRLVKAASRKLSEELHWTHEEAHQAIAELQRKHPGYCEYAGGLHLRATPQQWVQVYRWLLDAQEFRTWEKRLFCYLSDRERRIHRETAFRQAHVSIPETFHRVNLTRILRACPVPAPRGRNRKSHRIEQIKEALRHFASLKLITGLDLGRPGRAGSLRLRPTLYRQLADDDTALLDDRAAAAALTQPGAPPVLAAEPVQPGTPGSGGPAPQVRSPGAPDAGDRFQKERFQNGRFQNERFRRRSQKPP